MTGIDNAVSAGPTPKPPTLVNLKMRSSHRLLRKTTFSALRKHAGKSFLADVTVKSADGFEAKFNASLLAAASPVLATALNGGASTARVQVRSLSDATSLVVFDCSGRTVRSLLHLVSQGDGGSFASLADFSEAWTWTRELEMTGPKKLMMCAVCPSSVARKSREFEDSDELLRHLT